MSVIVLQRLLDMGDDVLRVEGTVDGVERVGMGWVSAMQNYFPPNSYLANGNRDPAFRSRPMNAAERLAYCQGLLLENVTSAPVDLVLPA